MSYKERDIGRQQFLNRKQMVAFGWVEGGKVGVKLLYQPGGFGIVGPGWFDGYLSLLLYTNKYIV
jgi:hypothetical protein